LGGDWLFVCCLGRRYARTEPIRSRQPSNTSTLEAARDGVECLELKFAIGVLAVLMVFVLHGQE
jgi:hypothetical protein